MRHPAITGVSVTIQVNQVNLQEYDTEDADKICTTYIEAISGANFGALVLIDRSFPYHDDDIAFEIQLDGKWAASRVMGVLKPGLPIPPFLRCVKLDASWHTINGKSYKQKFQFADLTTDDGHAASSSSSAMKDVKRLGTITIALFRVAQIESTDRYQDGGMELRNSNESIPEKSLKGRAISNRTVYGPREPMEQIKWCKMRYPHGTDPFMVFTFKYRSHKDLQIEGIIERSPSPVPLEDRDPSRLTREELQELLRRRDQELLELSKIKREKRERSPTIIDDDHDDDDEDVPVAGSGSAKRERNAGDSLIAVVDLTNED